MRSSCLFIAFLTSLIALTRKYMVDFTYVASRSELLGSILCKNVRYAVFVFVRFCCYTQYTLFALMHFRTKTLISPDIYNLRCLTEYVVVQYFNFVSKVSAESVFIFADKTNKKIFLTKSED